MNHELLHTLYWVYSSVLIIPFGWRPFVKAAHLVGIYNADYQAASLSVSLRPNKEVLSRLRIEKIKFYCLQSQTNVVKLSSSYL